MKKIIVCVLALLMATAAFTQTKVGTIDAEYILGKMPELAQQQEALKVYSQDLDKQLTNKVTAYEAALETANSSFATLTDAQKATIQQELSNMEIDITEFRQNGTQLVQLKQAELINPLYTKISVALEAVAKELGYTQVLTVGNNNIAFADPTYDLTKAVMTKMGIAIE